jgi:hypothetical protein
MFMSIVLPRYPRGLFQAPEARSSVARHGAQRSAGNPEPRIGSPGGTVESALHRRESVLPQEQSPLLRKITCSVMFPLISDVRFGFIEQGRAHAGGRVAGLPLKSSVSEILIAPLRRARLDELHGFGQRHRRGKSNQDMSMIVEAPDRERYDAVLPGNSRHE